MVILYLYRVPYDPTIVFFLEADFLFRSILRLCVPCNCKATAEWLQSDCQATAKRLPSDCRATAEQLPSDCQATAERLSSDCQATVTVKIYPSKISSFSEFQDKLKLAWNWVNLTQSHMYTAIIPSKS